MSSNNYSNPGLLPYNPSNSGLLTYTPPYTGLLTGTQEVPHINYVYVNDSTAGGTIINHRSKWLETDSITIQFWRHDINARFSIVFNNDNREGNQFSLITYIQFIRMIIVEMGVSGGHNEENFNSYSNR